ncbi:TPA: DUF2620 family protein [Escherichia coli]|nr:DUF2620 family protein [Escherichia coli]
MKIPLNFSNKDRLMKKIGGAGAALSIAIAVIGYNKSCTIAKPGIKAKDEHIAKMIAEGKVAFGLSVEHVEHAIPMLINHLK